MMLYGIYQDNLSSFEASTKNSVKMKEGLREGLEETLISESQVSNFSVVKIPSI